MPRWPLALALATLVACGDKEGDDTGSDGATDGGATDGGDTDGGDTDGGDTELDGAELYEVHCATCHGPDGRGTADGADLLREVENHDDEFLVTVTLSGRGDMEPVDVSEAQARLIVAWLHELLGV